MRNENVTMTFKVNGHGRSIKFILEFACVQEPCPTSCLMTVATMS